MVLSEEEKAENARKERAAMLAKQLERERILAESKSDRARFNAVHAAVPAVAAPLPQKVLLRLRYEVEGQKGRKPIELEGTVESVSLFHLFQAIQDQMSVPFAMQMLRPADEGTWPLQPKDEMLPAFSSFAAIADFPSLQALGIRNHQELFLTQVAEKEMQAPSMSVIRPAPSTTSEAAQGPSAKTAADVSHATSSVPEATQKKPTKEATAEPDSSAESSSSPFPSASSRSEVPQAPPQETRPQPSASGNVTYNEKQQMHFIWNAVDQQKLALHRAREAKEAAEVQRVRTAQETVRLGGLLLWSSDQVEFYARLRAELDSTVGLEPVKDYIVQRLRDAAGRHILKEGKQAHRHILVSGHFGVGKRFAAELLGKLFSLLVGHTNGGRISTGARVRLRAQADSENRGALLSRNDLGVVVEELPSGTHRPLRVSGPSGRIGNYRHEELVVEKEFLRTLRALSDLVDAKTQKVVTSEDVCYFVRLETGGTLTDADGAILEAVLDSGSIVVIAGAPPSIEANLQLAAFRRRQPDLLELATLGPTELARMIATVLERRGYAGVGEGDSGTPEIVTVLEHIVRQRFDESLIREKNCHLANDILDLAISRKNDRTWLEPLNSPERFRLTPMDFGLDVLTAEQRERRLQEVEAEVSETVGWGAEEDQGTPRHFFKTLRRQLGSGDGKAANLARMALHLPKTLWVAANTGTGAGHFVQLAARFLRACGTTSREEVVFVDAADIAASDSVFLSRFAGASRGCLAIRGAEALAEAPDALRALLIALERAEASTTLIVLVGTPSGMARIGRMEPGLESRFLTRLKLPDLSADELVKFIQQSAGKLPSGALALEDGLAPSLALHISETYGEGIGGKDLGQSGNLDLARKLLQRAIQNRITRLFTRIQEGEAGESPERECLLAADFEVGASLGEGAEQKAAIDEEVDSLVGMTRAKEWFEQVRQKVTFVERTGTRSDLRVCLNIIITGNPGTGKTTFARLLAKFFHTYGVLSRDSFVEKNGLDLKADHMGGTAPRVKAAVKEAMGGCLFIDEAYALIDAGSGVGTHGDTFSQEAMRTLLTEVENNRTNLMVVLGGYKDKMGRLMRADEGLARRFPNRLHLEDYSPRELAQICEMAARQRHQREFEPGLCEKLSKFIENFHWRDIPLQNAGLAINLTEQALDRQIVRIVSKYPGAFSLPSRGAAVPGPLQRQRSRVSINQVKEDVASFTAADFGIEERPTLGDPEFRAQVCAEVNSMIGMTNVKAFFKEMSQTVAFVERGGDPKVLQTSLNLQLTGNPGTGKTTTARMIARYLHAHGVLPRDAFVERNALVLKGQFVGQTAPTVVEAVRDAMGGCLFIDEAYALADRGGDKFSGEVVRTLLTEVENHRTGLLVVLAGYADKMEQLMDADPGLRRRFCLVLHLEDYSPHELADICEKVAKDRFDLSFAPGLKEALGNHIATAHGHEIQQHNGGLAVTLAERAFRRLATRLGGEDSSAILGGTSSRQLLLQDFEIGDSPSTSSVAFLPKQLRRDEVEQSRETRASPPHKKARALWREVVGSFAQDLANELMRSVGDVGQLDEDDCTGGAFPSGPSREGRSGAVAKALAKVKAKETFKEEKKEEEMLPRKEGERVLEEMDTRDALDKLGVCPANFEWFELSPVNPPDENCGICGYRLADGYRCGGGTHFVCMGCIDAYKTRSTED